MAANDIPTALSLLTRLPATGSARGARAAWAWPVAGVVVALVQILVGIVALGLALQPGIAAALIIAAGIFATGALHEDGLADTADGLWGGHDRARRLEIMKDSRIGSYGTLALITVLLIRWTALMTLCASVWIVAPLLVAAMLSRSAMAMIAFALPHARSDGLSHLTGRPGRDTAFLALGVALLGSVLLIGAATIPVTLAVAAPSLVVALIARARIGGQTGDILGATQILAETAALATLASMI